MKTDIQLQRDVLDELKWEPSVDAAQIGVTARDGVVTLTGHVPSYTEKVAAGDATQRVLGVQAVANDLEVQPHGTGRRDDADIARAAVDALRWRSTIPGEGIKVAVSKGWITLEGDVEWFFQKNSAEEAVRHLLGVRGVINDIAVKPKASAAEVRSRIESAFRRTAELEAEKVRVETRDGKVTLRGTVRSWSERQEAERTAWAAPGVSSVVNQITVAPYVTAYAATP